MTRRAIVTTVTLAVLSLVHVPASAQDDAARAKRLYEQGSTQYDAGKYREASRSLREAYDLVGRPALLYNIGMAEWRAGEDDRAVEAFERALNLELPGTLRVRTQARLQGILATRVARRRAVAIDEAPARPFRHASQSTASSTETGFGWRGWTGAMSAVAGAGLLTGAGMVSLQIARREDELYEAADANDADRLSEVTEEIEGLQAIGPPLLYSGALLTAVGATLLVWEISGGNGESPRVSFHAAGTSTGCAGALRLRF